MCAQAAKAGSGHRKQRALLHILLISPTHKRTEGRAPVWGSEFTSKNVALQGDISETAAALSLLQKTLHYRGIYQKPLLG
jgi:hypothetical protein